MRLIGIVLLMIVGAINMSFAQSKAELHMAYNGNTYDVYIILIDSTSIARFDIVQNKAQLAHKDMVAQLSANGANGLMAINAAVSGQNCETEGLLIIDSTEFKPINLKDGSANFYLKPNGVLLFTGASAAIVESSMASTYKGITNAVQSGPMLVNGKKINPNFSATSTNKNIRCGVGLYKAAGLTYLVFATSNNPVNFYDFANLFIEKYKCTEALCLESAGCAMYISDIARTNATDNNTICNYLIYRED